LEAGMGAAGQCGQGLCGVSRLLVFCWILSENGQARPRWKGIGGSLLLQITIALVIVRVPFVWEIIGLANEGVMAM